MLKEQAISLLTQVKELILGSESWLDSTHQPIEEAFSMAIEALEQPEIIHCKNCEHNESSSEAGNANCNKFYGMTDQMGFCHYGERRTDE